MPTNSARPIPSVDPTEPVPPESEKRPRGRLVLHGGGSTPTEFRSQVLDSVGGTFAPVLAIPHASSLPENGTAILALWREAGAEAVELLDLANPAHAVAQVEAAALIWLSSGDQCRLVDRMNGTGVPEALKKRYDEGATLGGISAGAAAMSAVMITGEPSDPTTGATHTAPGLGLWPRVIVDQHLLVRQRIGRLARAVRDHPGLIGVGLDETAFITVRDGGWFEVGGASLVVVIDPRVADEEPLFLEPGSIYHLDRGRVREPGDSSLDITDSR